MAHKQSKAREFWPNQNYLHSHFQFYSQTKQNDMQTNSSAIPTQDKASRLPNLIRVACIVSSKYTTNNNNNKQQTQVDILIDEQTMNENIDIHSAYSLTFLTCLSFIFSFRFVCPFDDNGNDDDKHGREP